MGIGVFRNYYKDTWTKSRGRVEAGEGAAFGWVRGSGGEKMQTNIIEQQ